LIYIILMTRYQYILKNKNGLTLVEVIIAVVVFAMIIPGIVMFLNNITQGFTTYECISSLKKNNQETLNRIYASLLSSRRIFENNTDGTLYLSKLYLTGCPPLLTGSKLPLIEENGTLSPGTTGFISGSAGNELFFAANDSTTVMMDVLDSSSTKNTIRLDLYRFYYYYLTAENPKSIGDKASYRIVEWKSVTYVDYIQLMNVSGGASNTLLNNTVAALYKNNVKYAWNSSMTDVTKAFYSLSQAGSILAVNSPSIDREKCTVLTAMITGIMGGGFRYGISPNSAGWARAPKTVPQYGIASGNFPGGFEVTIVGSSSGRKTLIRSILVAQGSMKSIIADDQLIVCTCRDLW